MAEVTVPIGQLVFHIGEYSRDPAGEGRELVTVGVGIENRASDLGGALQPPLAELRDGQGRTYALAAEERRWAEPVQPNTSASARLAFEVPVDATTLELALAAGTDDEVVVPLV